MSSLLFPTTHVWAATADYGLMLQLKAPYLDTIVIPKVNRASDLYSPLTSSLFTSLSPLPRLQRYVIAANHSPRQDLRRQRHRRLLTPLKVDNPTPSTNRVRARHRRHPLHLPRLPPTPGFNLRRGRLRARPLPNAHPLLTGVPPRAPNPRHRRTSTLTTIRY